MQPSRQLLQSHRTRGVDISFTWIQSSSSWLCFWRKSINSLQVLSADKMTCWRGQLKWLQEGTIFATLAQKHDWDLCSSRNLPVQVKFTDIKRAPLRQWIQHIPLHWRFRRKLMCTERHSGKLRRQPGIPSQQGYTFHLLKFHFRERSSLKHESTWSGQLHFARVYVCVCVFFQTSAKWVCKLSQPKTMHFATSFEKPTATSGRQWMRQDICSCKQRCLSAAVAFRTTRILFHNASQGVAAFPVTQNQITSNLRNTNTSSCF